MRQLRSFEKSLIDHLATQNDVFVISSLHLEALVFKANKEKFPKWYDCNMVVYIPIFASFHCNFAFRVKAFVLICVFYRFRSKDAGFFSVIKYI